MHSISITVRLFTEFWAERHFPLPLESCHSPLLPLGERSSVSVPRTEWVSLSVTLKIGGDLCLPRTPLPGGGIDRAEAQPWDRPSSSGPSMLQPLTAIRGLGGAQRGPNANGVEGQVPQPLSLSVGLDFETVFNFKMYYSSHFLHDKRNEEFREPSQIIP